MRFKTALVSLFVALAIASRMDDLALQMPTCAKQCFDEDSKKAGCATDDYTCQCTKAHGVMDGSSPCIATSCCSDDQKKTTEVVTEICLHVAHDVGADTFNSALHSLAGAAGSAFAGVTSALGPAFTSATGAAGDIFTSATAAAGDAYTSATAEAGDVWTSATAAAGDAVGGAASPTTSTAAAADRAAISMGIVGAGTVFALAL